jgi:hypothetical protein
MVPRRRVDGAASTVLRLATKDPIAVIPGRGLKGREPGIHNLDAAEYGFRAPSLRSGPGMTNELLVARI